MITIEDLREAERHLEKQLTAVKNHIAALVGAPKRRGRSAVGPKKRRMSAKGRAAIAAAQKKRWAKVKAAKS